MGTACYRKHLSWVHNINCPAHFSISYDCSRDNHITETPLCMKFYCIIVTFNPDIKLFTKVLNSISINTKYIDIVDNGSSNIEEIRNINTDFNLTCLTENLGIAAAQNIGIKAAFSHDADYIWLSDQDTIYSSKFILNMCNCITELKQKKINYSVIGPCYIDSLKNKLIPFIRYTPFAQEIIPNRGINFVSQLISSGMVIPVSVFAHVGYKREDLFIDWVDFEWCWRSEQLGYKVVVYEGETIRHALGDKVVSFLGKKITLRSPDRRYFFIRNSIYLSLHSNAIPIQARIEIFIKTFIWMFIFPMASENNKLDYFRASLLGFFHGLTARLGPKSE